MVQLYNPPITQLLRSLLLQCVFLLGIVSMAVAQTYPAPAEYHGPWRTPTSSNVKTNGLVADGANIEPSGAGGSAQFRTTSANVDVKLNGNGLTGYKLSYSIVATTTRSGSASMTVSYSTDGGQTFGNGAVTSDVPKEATTIDLYLPAAATDVRFQLASVTDAYVFLDAVKVSQQPEVDGFTPAGGVPGTPVTITGTHLNETSAVFFGTVPAESITVNPEGTSVSTVVPTGAKSAPIRVVTSYGEASTAEFKVPAPVFATSGSQFAPTGAGAGETITLFGQYFTGVNEVLFNGAAADASTIRFVSDGEITVVVPKGASAGPITATSPAGSGVSSAFTVYGPQIIAQAEGSEFTPTEGPALTTEVTIYGDYFTAVNEVLFNGVKATSFAVVSDEEITATVPLGAGTGPITVKSPAGEAVSTAVYNVPAPQFVTYDNVDSQFKPTSAGPNMQITLYGVNLASVSSVVFLGAEGDDSDNVVATFAAPTNDTELVVTVPADAKTGKIQLIAPGDKTATSEQIFNFVPAPIITEVANTTATDGGTYGLVGEQITITGQDFGTAYEVILGNTTLNPTTETNTAGFTVNVEGTAITFNIPDGAASGSVTVKTQGGEATWEGPFDVIYAPTIASFSPVKGPIGQEVTITGQYLKYVSEVVFLGSSASEDDNKTITFSAPHASDTEIKVTVPTGAITGFISITNPANTTTSADEYEVIVIPVINAFTPTRGVAGNEVTITGYNFLGTTSVTFGESGLVAPYDADTNPGGFTVVSDTELTVQVPVDATTGLISITNAMGTGSSESNFTITQKPTITGVSPLKGVVGSKVVIEGTEFVGDNIVVTFLGAGTGVVATSITVESSTKITATVPEGALTGKLMVTNAAGNSEPSIDTYLVVTAPEIISFTPTEGKAGDDVIIKGWLLESVTAVGFNGGVQATPKYNAADSTITVVVPTNATTGTLTLIVGEDVVFTSADVFTVIPAPTIVSFTPAQGIAGTEVTINGTNFIKVSGVAFDGKLAAIETVQVNETFDALTVTVPYDATTGKITITADAGEAVSEDDFTVPVPANITFTNNSQTPTTSYANQLVTIRGQYFTNATEVDFNGKKVNSGITVVDEVEGNTEPDRYQMITVKAPFDAGIGKITVTTPAGSGVSAADYTVIEPKISSISAAEGYVGKTVVTIKGELFTQYWDEASGAVATQAPKVRFGSAVITAEDYEVDGTEVTVTVPNGATSGSLVVISGSGESEPMQFNILAPILSSVEPQAVYAGQSVTVTGTNFINVTGMSYGGNISITGYNIVLTDQEQGTGTITFTAPVVQHNSTNTLSVTSTSGTGTTEALTIYKPIITNVTQTGKTGDRRVYAGVNTITITGTRFDEYWNGSVVRGTPIVTFAGADGARVNASIESFTPSGSEDGQDVLVVNVPANAITGSVQVQSGSGTGESVDELTIIGAPTITNFSTNAGLEGATFTINGTNFDDATKVTFLGIEGEADEVDAVEYTVNASSNAISVKVPVGATIGKIAVTTPYGDGTTITSSQIFRVVKAPIVHDFNLKEGPTGSTVTITGENLIAVSGRIKVSFKGHGGDVIPATDVNLMTNLPATVNTQDLTTARQITVTVPADAIKGVITLTNEAGTTTTAEATATEVDVYTVTSPVLVRFERENGSIITEQNPARRKERVLLRGYNLEGIGTIRIGTVYATSFFEPDDKTRVEVVVPLTATSSTVTITAAGGEDISSDQLYIAVPTIKVDPGSLSFNVEAGQISEAKSYTVSAMNLAVGENLAIRVTGANDFYMAVSKDAADDAWSKGMPALTPDAAGNIAETTFWVRSQPGIDASTNQSGAIAHTSNGAATANLSLSTTVLPLPVELMSFNAALQNNNVLLTWATASEQNNSHFEVEMSRNPKSGFEKIGRVESKGSNSMTRLDYEFMHRLGNLTGTIYYRLKQVDTDGTTDYSKVVAVNVKAREVLQQVLVAPNPINYNSKLYVSAEVSGKANLVVYSMTGKKVYAKVVELQEGPNEVQLPVYEKLNKGMYILSVELNGQVSQVKLVKE